MSNSDVQPNGTGATEHDVSGVDGDIENEVVKSARAHAEDTKRRADMAKKIGVGAAIGVGSAAIVAGLIYWKRDK